MSLQVNIFLWSSLIFLTQKSNSCILSSVSLSLSQYEYYGFAKLIRIRKSCGWSEGGRRSRWSGTWTLQEFPLLLYITLNHNVGKVITSERTCFGSVTVWKHETWLKEITVSHILYVSWIQEIKHLWRKLVVNAVGLHQSVHMKRSQNQQSEWTHTMKQLLTLVV